MAGTEHLGHLGVQVEEWPMKLLYCPNCNSVFNLVEGKWKMCECGRTRGRYMDDLHAVYSGGIPLGFNNFTFAPALREQPKKGLGRRFEAFVIPKQCPTMEKIDPEERPQAETGDSVGEEK